MPSSWHHFAKHLGCPWFLWRKSPTFSTKGKGRGDLKMLTPQELDTKLCIAPCAMQAACPKHPSRPCQAERQLVLCMASAESTFLGPWFGTQTKFSHGPDQDQSSPFESLFCRHNCHVNNHLNPIFFGNIFRRRTIRRHVWLQPISPTRGNTANNEFFLHHFLLLT